MDEQAIHQRRWLILGVLVVGLLVVILDNTILNVALKTIQQDLNASQSQMQWAVDAYALVFAGLLITWGVLGDRLGRKWVLLGGLATFGVTSALCSFAHSPTELIFYRALMGIGAAAVMPQTLSIIQNVFEPRERAKAIGIWAGASGVGIALGPIVGGALIKYFWWGSIFLVNVPIVIVGVIAILIVVPNSKDPNPGRLDPFGVLLSIVALGTLVYGIIEGGNSNDWLRWNTLGAIVLGLALLALFLYVESRSSHPSLDVTLFKNRQFSAGTGAIALTFFALMGSTFYLAYYLQAVRGYTPLAAGVALIAVAAGVMVFSALAARLSQLFGARVVAGGGLTLFGLAMMSFGLSTEHMPQFLVELQMLGMGAGMGLTMTPATNAIMSAVPREKAGVGSAVNNTVRQVAGALGVAVLGSLLTVVFRNEFGSHTPHNLAKSLDQPSAAVSQMPASAQVGPHVTNDASESIGGALTFVQDATKALQTRGQLPQAANVPPAQIAQSRAAATHAIGGFVEDARHSFVTAMNVTSVASGAVGLIGAVVAFMYLPGREEEEVRAGAPEAAEAALAH